MEMVYGKIAQMGLSGFVFGAGLEAVHLTDSYLRNNIAPLIAHASGTGHLHGEAAVATPAASPSYFRDKPAKWFAASASAPSLPASAPTVEAPATQALLRMLRSFWLTPPPAPPQSLLFSYFSWKSLPARPAWQQIALLSLNEGLRISKLLMIGTAAAGVVGVWRHGRDYEAIFDHHRDSVPVVVGASVGLYCFTPRRPRALRVAYCAVFAGAMWWLLERQKRR